MDPSIPIFVESVKTLKKFSMTRCNYLAIESESPEPWMLGIQDKEIPILLLGMQALIINPSEGKTFNSAEQIEGFISTIETSNKSLFVTVDDIWLPNHLFTTIEPDWNENSNRNQVIRISQQLFNAAYKFRIGTITQVQFEELSLMLSNQFEYSEREHKSFRDWHRNSIELAKEKYHAREKSLVLKRVRSSKRLNRSRDNDRGFER